jgi:hypothetical protein
MDFCLSEERLFDCRCDFFSAVVITTQEDNKKSGLRALVEWERELGPDPLLHATKSLREVALEIFTTNGSLSVDCQAVVITNSL